MRRVMQLINYQKNLIGAEAEEFVFIFDQLSQKLNDYQNQQTETQSQLFSQLSD